MQTFCDRYNKTYTWDMKCAVMGGSSHQVATVLTQKLDLPISPEEFQKQVNIEYGKVLGNAILMPGKYFLYSIMFDYIQI